MLTSTKNLAAAEEKIVGLTEQLRVANEGKAAAETKLAVFEGTADGSIAALQAKLNDALASVTDLTGKLDKATGDLTAATAARDAYKAAIGEGEDALFAFSNPEGGKPALALTDLGVARFVNAKAARTLAAGGHQPLPLSVDNPAGASGGTNAPTGEGRTKTTWARQF